ncbi:hypothetical protein [Rhizobium herbae]|uniref:hypothetical protein n=1 Tax=Rhizobium herbae TaxID=508661 RepID=UPI001F4584C3|nr:hypothetical protein [Rhizobium herbae]
MPGGEPQFSRSAFDGSPPWIAAIQDFVQLAGHSTRHQPVLVRDRARRRRTSIVKWLWQRASLKSLAENRRQFSARTQLAYDIPRIEIWK